MSGFDETTGAHDALWESFAASVAVPLGLDTARLSPATPLASLDGLGRAWVRQLISAASPDGAAPPDLLGELESLGDVYGWLEQFDWTGPHANSAQAGSSPADLMRGRRTSLRTVISDDLPSLYAAAINPQHGYRWRFKGATPSMQHFVDTLHQGALAQFCAVDAITGDLIGLTTAYNSRQDNGTCYVAFQRATPTSSPHAGEMFEAIFLLVEYLFRTWPLRRLYGEVPGFNYDQFASGEGSAFVVEGRLREHEFHAGQWWDLVLIAIERRHWARFAEQVGPTVWPTPGGLAGRG